MGDWIMIILFLLVFFIWSIWRKERIIPLTMGGATTLLISGTASRPENKVIFCLLLIISLIMVSYGMMGILWDRYHTKKQT